MCNVEGPPLKKARAQKMHEAEPLPIYLDFNATTPVSEAAWAAMLACKDHWGNPSSTHPYGLDGKYSVMKSREMCAAAVGLPSSTSSAEHSIIFTSGGTEANNLAIIGGARAVRAVHQDRCIVVASNFEHPAVEEVLRAMEKDFRDVWETFRVPVDPVTGVLEPAAFRSFLTSTAGLDPQRVALVTVMHANNELGSVQPIAALVQIVKEVCGEAALFHTDAAQSVGKIPTDMLALDVDYMSVCSHKFYGPKGVGALCVHPRAVKPLRVVFGAGHELGHRPGTENIILYAGMSEALRVACSNVATAASHMKRCRDTLLSVLQEELVKKPGMRLFFNGDMNRALPNTLNIAIGHEPSGVFISAHRLMVELGHMVCMSAGSACHSSLKEGEALVISAPLRAIGADEFRAAGTLRLTCGTLSTEDEMRRAGKFIARRACQQIVDL